MSVCVSECSSFSLQMVVHVGRVAKVRVYEVRCVCVCGGEVEVTVYEASPLH